MSLAGEDRKKTILELLDAQGKVSARDLVKKLDVSSETVRRYLEELEGDKQLRRVYGGAVKVALGPAEPAFYARDIENAAAKKKIARLASSLVDDNETIAMDEGTTIAQMVEFLVTKRITVLTTSLPILSSFTSYANQGIFKGQLYFFGGRIDCANLRASGIVTEKSVAGFCFDKAFISTEALHSGKGVMSYDVDKAMVSQAMIRGAQQSIVLADRQKFGAVNLSRIAGFGEIDIVISDDSYPPEWKIGEEYPGLEWLVAD